NSNGGGGSHNYFNGAIDEVAIYNRGMGAGDVLAMAGATPSQAEQRLPGTAIGTSGLVYRYFYDDNLATFVQGPADGTWVGFDLDSAKRITQVQFAPAPGQGKLMQGGIFQGSNTADFTSGVVNLFTIPANANIVDGQLTRAIISNS